MSPLPMAMDARGAPPIPGIQLNAAVIMIMGNVMPMPPRAMVPTPGICPIYILSTMLYRALTSWAMVMGMVSLIKRGRICAPAS